MGTTIAMEPTTNQVSILHRISNIVSSERSVDEMLGEVIGLTVQVTDCDACLVYLIEPFTGETSCAPLRCLTSPKSGT